MKKFFVLISILLVLLISACTYDVSCDPLDLIQKIKRANRLQSSDTLELAQGCIYDLTWIQDITNGNNGLPVIKSEIIINGNGATIQRALFTDHFRIFQNAYRNKLFLNDLTIQNGYAAGEEDNDFADVGGGILNFGILRLDTVVITGNYAGYVGGIYNASSGSVKMYRSTISHNNADRLTNGILNTGSGGMGIYESTIRENGFITKGDAIFNNGTLSVVNSTISNNAGAGIDNDKDTDGPANLTLVYVTFSSNSVALDSNIEINEIANTLFGPHEIAACSTGTTFDREIGVSIDTDGSCNITTVSPDSLKLGPLAYNGGPTKTHQLGSGSLAINAVNGGYIYNTDQRGVERPQNRANDVGSYEYDGPILMSIPEHECTYTALTNLFCRLGPGSSLYPEIDSFTSGQQSKVIGISPDGNFVQVVGMANQLTCYVPKEGKYGELSGSCNDLPVLALPEIPEELEDKPKDKPDDESVEGCNVLQDDGSAKCVAPCPVGIVSEGPCTKP